MCKKKGAPPCCLVDTPTPCLYRHGACNMKKEEIICTTWSQYVRWYKAASLWLPDTIQENVFRKKLRKSIQHIKISTNCTISKAVFITVYLWLRHHMCCDVKVKMINLTVITLDLYNCKTCSLERSLQPDLENYF